MKEVRGEELLKKLALVGSLMPDAKEMAAFARACDREQVVGPIMYPSAYMQGHKRMEKAAALCQAGVAFMAAFEEWREVTVADSDPEADEAARTLIRRFHEKHGNGGRV